MIRYLNIRRFMFLVACLMYHPAHAQLPPDILRGQAMLDMRMMDLQRQQREDRMYRLEVARYRMEAARMRRDAR